MISVVLAVYNEQRNLAKCLQAVKHLADEIIVVDGQSSDDTVKIAKSLKARVISTTNKPNFHINKQMAMDAAQGHLVLQLDADEVVDDQLAKFISKIHTKYMTKYSVKGQKRLNLPSDALAAWYLNRKNWFLGRFMQKGGQYPDPVIRLYVNGYARLPQKDVHEQMNVEGQVGTAEGHLMHYANPSFADYLRKFNTYTSFKASQLKSEGVKINLYNSLLYFIWKPKLTFLSLYLRHKGFMDGAAGFVFALMSGLHHSVAYLKLWELLEKKTK